MVHKGETRMKKLLALALVACAALAAAAAAQTASAWADAATSLTIYSGREERLVKPLFDRFTRETGIALNVRYGSSAEMAATILEEGRNSRADVFFAQEAGLLGFVAREGLLAVMRIKHGEDRTRDWLLGLKANEVRFYGNNTQVVQAAGRGEILLGLVNHYYLHNLRVQTPDIPVENAFLGRGDPGALVNCAGVGIVTSSKKSTAAQRFVDFLLSPWAQRFIARGPGGAEYPLIRGVRPRPGLPQLGEIKGPEINLGRLGRDLPPAVRLLNEVGYIR